MPDDPRNTYGTRKRVADWLRHLQAKPNVPGFAALDGEARRAETEAQFRSLLRRLEEAAQAAGVADGPARIADLPEAAAPPAAPAGAFDAAELADLPLPADAADRRSGCGIALAELERAAAESAGGAARAGKWEARLLRLAALLRAAGQEPPPAVYEKLGKEKVDAAMGALLDRPELVLAFLGTPEPTLPAPFHRGDDEAVLDDGGRCLRYFQIWNNLNDRVAARLLARLRSHAEKLRALGPERVPGEWTDVLEAGQAPAQPQPPPRR